MKLILAASLFFSVSALLGGCAAPQRQDVQELQVQELRHRFQLEFSSVLADRVVPSQAPIDAHSRYPLNERLERRLQQQVDARSTATADSKVTVSVNVLDLDFDYEEIGARRTVPGLPQLASRGETLSSLEMNGGGLEIPYETIKTAVLTFDVTLEQGGRTLAERRLGAEYVETVRRDDLQAVWPHDYHSYDKVVSGLIEAAAGKVDELLVEFFGGT